MTTWRERIALAREQGMFTAEDKNFADSWDTCAVGEQHKLYSGVLKSFYKNLFCPVDSILINLGSWGNGFAYAVRSNRPNEAEEFLDRIEDRVMELKRESGTQNCPE